MGDLPEISKTRFEKSRILAYKHESLFPDYFSCFLLVSFIIAELTGGRQNI